ncbi:GlsB/YeaQ/YmgE family stress response membrane protein [Mariniblastus sp.]|nr:GlsB/YeaQ/YmgE family stress response membrane protein [Mariniblastus sp.]
MELVQLADYCNLALTWIGFGTVVGLAAKALMPGRDPGGAIATVLMGIAGTLIGCACLQYFSGNQAIQPVSLQGFFVGAAGALLILIFYKVLGGYWFVEGEQTTYRRRRTRRRSRTVYDD